MNDSIARIGKRVRLTQRIDGRSDWGDPVTGDVGTVVDDASGELAVRFDTTGLVLVVDPTAVEPVEG